MGVLGCATCVSFMFVSASSVGHAQHGRTHAIFPPGRRICGWLNQSRSRGLGKAHYHAEGRGQGAVACSLLHSYSYSMRAEVNVTVTKPTLLSSASAAGLYGTRDIMWV